MKPPTETPEKTTLETNSANGRHGILLLLASLLLFNSFLARFLFSDQGINSALCAVAALLIIVPLLLRIVLEDFRHGRVHMNELVLIAVVAGASRGDLLTAGLIAFFMLVGLIMETRSATGARQSLEELTRLTQIKARKLNPDGTETEMAPEFLTCGDRIRIRPGEAIPVDGEIESGSSAVQEAGITGESLPVDKFPGGSVFAGTFNMSGVLDVSVSRTGRDTTLGKVRELILAAERTKPRFMRMIDRYAHYYTPLVLLMAFFIWAVNGHQMDPVVAVLVAACPIALVLSTPSAAVAALSAGARLGILIKNIGDIEVLSSITSFIFDKTGTLTTGNLDVVEIAPVDGVEAAELVRIAAGIESGSNHPVAKAVCRFAEKVRVPRAESDEIREVAGKGLLGNVDGSRIIVGNRIWLEENGIPASQFPDFGDEVNHGLSLLFVARDGLALGWISLGDSIREDAAECMDSIRREGIGNLGIVTGDRAGVAAHVAEELKIPLCWGECKPTEKVERIRQIKSHGHRTAFVGDGVNDAPALAASDIGIAMGAAGSDLAVETATIALMNNKLNRLPFLLRLAKDYRRIMIQNFVLGAVFIVLGVTAGAVGYLTAVPAACVQVASAILIVMNSARLVRSGESIR